MPAVHEPTDLTYRDVATMTGSPVATVYSWVWKNTIPHYRLGARHVRFRKSEILAWIEAKRRGPQVAA